MREVRVECFVLKRESGVVVESALKNSEMVDGLCRPMSRKRDCKRGVGTRKGSS